MWGSARQTWPAAINLMENQCSVSRMYKNSNFNKAYHYKKIKNGQDSIIKTLKHSISAFIFLNLISPADTILQHYSHGIFLGREMEISNNNIKGFFLSNTLRPLLLSLSLYRRHVNYLNDTFQSRVLISSKTSYENNGFFPIIWHLDS